MPLIKNYTPASLLDLAEDEIEVDWIVVFEETDVNHWWEKWLKPGFLHVSAVRWDGFNWIYVSDMLGYTRIEILPWGYHTRPEHNWKHNKGVKPHFLHVKRVIKAQRIRKKSVVGFNSCVECIKNLLGVDSFSLFTPYQLYKYLMKEREECESIPWWSFNIVAKQDYSKKSGVSLTIIRGRSPKRKAVAAPRRNQKNSSAGRLKVSTSSSEKKIRQGPLLPEDVEDVRP